jgi:hypothetical protein
MSEHENIEARLCSYVEGDLDAEARAEIEKYLLANPQYRALIAELGRTRGLLSGLPRESAPAELLETLSGQIERSALLGDDDAAAMQIRPNRFGHLAAWAAVLMLTGGLAAVIYRVLPSNKSQPEIALLKPAPPAVSATPGMADDSIRSLNELDKSLNVSTPTVSPEAAPAAVAAAIAPAATAPMNEQVAAVPPAGSSAGSSAAAAQPALPMDALTATAPAVASADAMVVSGGTTVANGNSLSGQPLGSIVGGDATQAGQNMYVTLRATDARAADARVTQYLNNNGIQFESRAIDRSAGLSAGPLAPMTPAGNAPQNYAMAEGRLDAPTMSAGAKKDSQSTDANLEMSAGERAMRRAITSQPSFAFGQVSGTAEPPAAGGGGNVIFARNLTVDQAKRLASDLDVKVLPAEINLQQSTEAIAADEAAVSADSPLQAGDSLRVVAREKLLPDVDAMNEAQTIDADGNLTLPLVGKIQAAGLTAAQLAQKIPQAYRDAKSPTDANWTISRIPATVAAVGGDLTLTKATPAVAPLATPLYAATAPAAAAASSINGGQSDHPGIDVMIRVIGQAVAATEPVLGAPPTTEASTVPSENADTAAPVSVVPAATLPTTMPGG